IGFVGIVLPLVAQLIGVDVYSFTPSGLTDSIAMQSIATPGLLSPVSAAVLLCTLSFLTAMWGSRRFAAAEIG
ncbi:MAG: hypothetical protein WKF60_12690, partial [Ilumatobacter sp.]